jgi:hypothetical protein
MATFFSQIGYKPTQEWKEEIVSFDLGKAAAASAAGKPQAATFPDGKPARLSPDQDPRELFANWLTAPENPWFARNIVNRVWSWLIGRGHYGQVFSAVVAGGGFKGGRVVGASDAKGEEVKERPVYPCDLIGSIYELLGIDPDGKLPNPQGLDLRLTPTAADGINMGGRLKEIM